MFIETLQDHVDVLSEINADTKLDSSHLSAIGSLIEALGELETNDMRYRKLRAWLISAGRFRATDTNCGASDTWFFGPTFDAAVDALPETGERPRSGEVR